ncbi:sulfotransferase 1C2-like [Saccoglossus kowalevskii]|uniref:Sulfotransferase 1C2-like n=1 Tax=Saccoglossus kowalevskii TaxID=10224 RepID=A0ABM0N0V0_SACKO|nr:PREDICTED: sulfotransferase 1C2-like [Saccoglossus kowalevskii]
MDEHTKFVKAEDCNYYGGRRYPKLVTEAVFDAMKTFEVRDDDIWLLTYPKAGTTWMMEIIHHILDHGIEGYKISTTDRALYPEYVKPRGPSNYELLKEAPSPRFIASHLPGHLLPPQIHEHRAKIIYVARNAKDVAVSMYYHHKVDPMIPKYQSWEEFYDAFINNDVIFGSWADHTLYWWNRRFEDNVMFVTYKQMKKDLAGMVSQVARFLDISLENQIKGIADKCTFQNMKKNAPRQHPNILGAFKVDQSQSPFVRKGKVGSWKSQFTVAQNDLFDERYKEWIGDSGLTFTA